MEDKKFRIGNFLAEKGKDGLFGYTYSPTSPLKQDGALKKRFKEMPRFKVILEVEKNIINQYDHLLVDSVKEMSQVLNNFGH